MESTTSFGMLTIFLARKVTTLYLPHHLQLPLGCGRLAAAFAFALERFGIKRKARAMNGKRRQAGRTPYVITPSPSSAVALQFGKRAASRAVTVAEI